MKHYPHHIGDFDRATRHLTRIERSVYRDLIDLYYDTEERLTLDLAALCRRIVARSNEESTAVEQTLNEFFTKTPTGWYHERCEEEIAAYRANSSQRAQAGKASAEAKRLKKLQAMNGNSTPVEQPLPTVATSCNGEATNQSTNQPINQEPGTTDSKARAPRKPVADAAMCLTLSDLITEGVQEQHAKDWLRVRKEKRAPLTQTAWDEVKAEAIKAGMTPAEAVKTAAVNSWQGFKASWLSQPSRASPAMPVNRQEAIEARNAAVGDEWLRQQGIEA
jgi:uncharacterized protein YdaU (DUF1376 family)